MACVFAFTFATAEVWSGSIKSLTKSPWSKMKTNTFLSSASDKYLPKKSL